MGEKVTLANWIRELYINLMDNGYTMTAVDDMDLYGYLDIKSYQANKDIKMQISALDAAGL